MGVYTKTGDKGTTSLVGGTRVSKCDARLEAYGTIDEAQANVALLRDWLVERDVLPEQQQLLLSVLGAMMKASAIVASEPDVKKVLPCITAEDVAVLERAIDAIEAVLPKIDKFTLPGGSQLVSQSHVARTVVRRAERRVVAVVGSGELFPEVLLLLNRLSDYLYVLGRRIAMELGAEEILWIP